MGEAQAPISTAVNFTTVPSIEKLDFVVDGILIGGDLIEIKKNGVTLKSFTIPQGKNAMFRLMGAAQTQ